MKLCETFWQWGHPEGCFNTEHGNARVSRMTPMEGCLYLGVQKTFMVPMELQVDRRQYNKSFVSLRDVVWEFTVDYENGIRPEQADPLITEAREFPNISGVVLDDFVNKDRYLSIPVESLWALREYLHQHALQMWMVLYTHEFGFDPDKDLELKKYIAPFDGITMWNWREENYLQIPEKFQILENLLAPHQKRLIGCYLYNFGQRRPSTGEAVTWQLDLYRELILSEKIDGVVLHTNALADVEYEAYDACREWMALHGSEEISR